MSPRRRGTWIRLAALAAIAALSGCSALARLRDRLGYVSNATTSRPSPTPPLGALAAADYVMAAFPDARNVRIDPQSPKLSLAAEAVLTRNDPHLRRGAPRFSPDGRLVAYEETDRAGGDRWLVIRKLDGVVIRRFELTSAGARHERRRGEEGLGVSPMTWAPSSDEFAVARETPLGAWEIHISELAGDSRRVEGPPAVPGSLAWSPDAERIGYVPATRTREIWTVDVATRVATRLATAPAAVQSFTWSSDGSRIALSSGNQTRDLYVVDVPRGGKVGEFRAITTWTFDDISPSFSPDGRWIAFYSNFRPLGALAGWSLLAVSADGTDAPAGAALMDRVRSTNASVHEDETPPPAWTPDSRWIAIAEPQSNEFHAIVMVDAARSNRNELSPESITNEDVAVSVDGVFAYRARADWGDNIVIGLVERGATRLER